MNAVLMSVFSQTPHSKKKKQETTSTNRKINDYFNLIEREREKNKSKKAIVQNLTKNI